MSIKPKDIYEGTKKTHRASKIITAVIIVTVALVIGLFFGLRQYCVYDDDGNATLIMPWNRKDGEGEKNDTGSPADNTPAPSPADTEPSSPEPDGTETPEDTRPDSSDAAGTQPDTGITDPLNEPSDTPVQNTDAGTGEENQ